MLLRVIILIVLVISAICFAVGSAMALRSGRPAVGYGGIAGAILSGAGFAVTLSATRSPQEFDVSPTPETSSAAVTPTPEAAPATPPTAESYHGDSPVDDLLDDMVAVGMQKSLGERFDAGWSRDADAGILDHHFAKTSRPDVTEQEAARRCATNRARRLISESLETPRGGYSAEERDQMMGGRA